MDKDLCSCGHTLTEHFEEHDRPCRDATCGCPEFREMDIRAQTTRKAAEEIIRRDAARGRYRTLREVIAEAEKEATPVPSFRKTRLPFKVEVTPFCPPETAYLFSESLDEKGQTKTEIVNVKNIGPAEEAKPAPAPESVYDRARSALGETMEQGSHAQPAERYSAISAALDAGEKAAADLKEHEYCWVGGGCARLIETEDRAEKAEARVEELEGERAGSKRHPVNCRNCDEGGHPDFCGEEDEGNLEPYACVMCDRYERDLEAVIAERDKARARIVELEAENQLLRDRLSPFTCVAPHDHPCLDSKCRCAEFQPKEKAPPSPDPESVYDRAREVLAWEDAYVADEGHEIIELALDAGENAEARVKDLEAAGTRLRDSYDHELNRVGKLTSENQLLRDRLNPFMDVSGRTNNAAK